MTSFRDILTSSAEDLISTIKAGEERSQYFNKEDKVDGLARELGLNTGQLICAIGFHPRFGQLPGIATLLGFDNTGDLIKKRNEVFCRDVYRKLSLDNVLTLYSVIKDTPEIVEDMQYLLENRLAGIETRIESTVNSTLIEKYKAEMRAIYMEGIAGIDFAENRLGKTDSGFRALLNEVVIITESKLIPAGNIFFRDNVLPEEKRKLLKRGLIPLDLVAARLEDAGITPREKKMLQEYLSANKQHNTGT